MIQVHLCVIYIFACLSKLQGESWWNGLAIWQAVSNLEYQSPRLDLAGLVSVAGQSADARHDRLGNDVLGAGMAAALRPFVLLAGTAIHLGIGAFMGMWTFGLAMIFAYVSFLPGQPLAALIDRTTSQFGRLLRRVGVDLGPSAPPRQQAAWFALGLAGEPLPPNRVDVGPAASETPASLPVPTASLVPIATPTATTELLPTPVLDRMAASEPVASARRDLPPPRPSILVVEGRLKRQAEVQEYFLKHGFRCHVASELHQARSMLAVIEFDALIVTSSWFPEDELAAFHDGLIGGGAALPASVFLLGSAQRADLPAFCRDAPTSRPDRQPQSARAASLGARSARFDRGIIAAVRGPSSALEKRSSLGAGRSSPTRTRRIAARDDARRAVDLQRGNGYSLMKRSDADGSGSSVASTRGGSSRWPRFRWQWWLPLAAAFAAGCAESSESPEVLVARGHLMESRGKLDEAVDAYTRALARRPDDASLYYDRGVALGRQGHWDDAIADYTQAIEHDAAMARAYNNRAAAYAHQRRFDAAAADFTKAISLDSKSALAYRNRGLAYHDLGQVAPSIEDYTVAIRLDPHDSQNLFERGNVYLDAGQYAKAISDFDQAIALDPKRAAAWLNRGEAHRRLGHTQQSQADLAQARVLDPNAKPSELVAAVPEKALLPAPMTSAPAASDPALRQERAIAVAAAFLRDHGYKVEMSTKTKLFPLAGRKGDQRILVRVQATSDGEPLRFTRDDLDQMAHPGDPTALVVVGELAAPVSRGQPFTGGTVIKFVENWRAIRDKLVPVVFEFPLR